MHKKKQLPLLWFLTGTIGDALMALALCQELAELNPDLQSTLFVRRAPQLVKDMAKLVPSVTVRDASFSPRSLWYIALALARRWQIMSAWHSVGLRDKLRSLFLCNPATRIVRFDMHEAATNHDLVAPYDMSKLVIDNFRVLAQTAGYQTRGLGSRASLPIAAAFPADFNLATNSYVVLHPFGSNDIKSLPLERCQKILNAVALAYPQLSFVITGGPQDATAANAIAKAVPRTKVAAGLPILQVAGLIQHAALYMGVDTGITHLSAMMGKDTLALEHDTMPRWFPTYNAQTVMLINKEGDKREGLWGITEDAVLAKLTQMHI